MKILYIIALVATVLFGVADIYYIQEYESAWSDYFWSSINSYDYSYSYYDDSYYEMREITFQAALVSLLFIAFYILSFSFTLAKIKRMTAKVMSIIGLCLAGIMFLLTLIPVADPGGVSWNEFGPALVIFILIMLAFCIVNLIQASRNEKPHPNQSVVDDID